MQRQSLHGLGTRPQTLFPPPKPQLDKPADGFSARRQVRLFAAPFVDRGECIIVPALAYYSPNAGFRTPACFFVARNY